MAVTATTPRAFLGKLANYFPLRFDLVRAEGFCSWCSCLLEFEQPALLFVAGREGLDARNDLCSGLRFRVLGFPFKLPDFDRDKLVCSCVYL
jgi:hypothetical protein